jgi:hypothetical protein
MKSLTKQLDNFFNFIVSIESMKNFLSEKLVNKIYIKSSEIENILNFVKSSEMYNEEYIDQEGSKRIRGFLKYKSIKIYVGYSGTVQDGKIDECLYVESENIKLFVASDAGVV